MIRLVDGKVKVTNSALTIGNTRHEAHCVRDPEDGHLDVCYEMEIEPDLGELVHFVFHDENDSEYNGVISMTDDGTIHIE